MRVLITGASGSLGKELVKKYTDQGYEITALFRTPQKQYNVLAINPNIKIVLTDITNRSDVLRACEGSDFLIHAAALKQIGVGEYHPLEFTRVNIQGTQVVADCWHAVNPKKPALLISTDKAVESLNLYGATKKVAESIFRHYDYSVLRYGNVIESEGSFVHVWKEAKPVTVRKAGTKAPTRFCLTMPEALNLITEVEEGLKAGMLPGIYIPHNLKAFNVETLAQELGLNYITNNLLPYEKLNEMLLANGEGVVKMQRSFSRVVSPQWDVDFRRFRSELCEEIDYSELVKMIKGIWYD